ncbi:MAG: hypothetical protein ACREMS_05120 [Gemmatimonadaceae bacterium]
MSPFRQTSLLVLLLSALACKETSGPSVVTATFALHDINGRVLPTFLAATPGFTTTIVSGSLTLDDSGRASIVEHRIEGNGTETDDTASYNYKISGNKIDFESSVICIAVDGCPAPPVATIVGGGLSVDRYPSGGAGIVYNYRIAQPD